MPNPVQSAVISSAARNPSSLSSLVRALCGRGICFFLALVFLAAAHSVAAQIPTKSPRILGIASVRLYSTNLDSAGFYQKVFGGNMTLGDEPIGKDPLKIPLVMIFRSGQTLSLSNPLDERPQNFLAEVVFATDDMKGVKKYLSAHHISEEKLNSAGKDYFSVLDPEGHRIGFTEAMFPPGPRPSHAMQIIHAGFIVHDRAAMEHFYKDILGFRPYWHGGRNDDGIDNWVSFQVPDGSDWIEFMLNVPDNADKRLRGIMNHIALGVTDIHAAQEQLRKNGAPLTEEPKIGRDGKWQLNLYDPDGTRVEFMEFTPVQKPCCSEFTAPHPKP